MKNSIFVPIDLSDSNTLFTVVNYASNLAKHLNKKIILFHTYLLPQMVSNPLIDAETMQNMPVDIAYQQQIKTDTLQKLVQLVPDLKQVENDVVAVPESAEDLIGDYAKEKRCSLIIIGSNYYSGPEKLRFSQKDKKIITQAPCSVLMVPKAFQYKPISHIGLAIENDELENIIQLDMLFDIAENFKAFLRIVYVDDGDSNEKKQDEVYELVRERLGDSNWSYSTAFNSDLDQGITKLNQEFSIDLSALIYREHGFFQELINPEVRKKLMNNTESPLLILK